MMMVKISTDYNSLYYRKNYEMMIRILIFFSYGIINVIMDNDKSMRSQLITSYQILFLSTFNLDDVLQRTTG